MNIQLDNDSVWVDGFLAVLKHCHTSSDDDNPYVRGPLECKEYAAYRAGAIAAESYRKHAGT